MTEIWYDCIRALCTKVIIMIVIMKHIWSFYRVNDVKKKNQYHRKVKRGWQLFLNAQKIGEAVRTSTNNLCFRAKKKEEKRKKLYPCKTQLYCMKMGCNGHVYLKTEIWYDCIRSLCTKVIIKTIIMKLIWSFYRVNDVKKKIQYQRLTTILDCTKNIQNIYIRNMVNASPEF